ncbi:intein splicing protein [Necator americanus]|uniref:Intein splicing protein n=1 Tax=Necator americanus TaxID=51031 RepID=W2TDL7_NECAM|nr:intein splicing protein [Necator americanus]ETN79256.1 intein splicing protein [Necator americanus]
MKDNNISSREVLVMCILLSLMVGIAFEICEMRSLLVLALAIDLSYASFCGSSAVPFSFEALPDGQPVLGCARPLCFGWNEKGEPATDDGGFYRIKKHPDGFMRRDVLSATPFDHRDPRYFQQQIADCEPTFQSQSCEGDNQWVAGIAPLMNVSAFPIVVQCCTFEPLRLSSDRGIATINPGQIVVGGEVARNGTQYAFDYISNIEKVVSLDGGVRYEVYVRRFTCLPPAEPKKHVTLPGPAVYNAEEFRRSPQHHKAFQAPNVPLNNPIQIPSAQPLQPPMGNVIEGPFSEGENVVVEEVLAHDGIEIGTTTEPEPIYYPPVAQPQPAYYSTAGGYYCFTGDTKVRLIDGIYKRLDELEVDDWVQTLKDAEVQYAPVSFWLHRVPHQQAEFQKIELSDGSELKLTAKHFIYKTDCLNVGKEVTTGKISQQAVFADEVTEGDCLYRVTEDEQIITEKVMRVSKVKETGIYSPMTSNGKIIVNGIFASCHNIVESYSLQNTFFSADLPLGMDTLITMMDYVIPKNLVTM